jgi:radical SAM superfamily enzyme YgiQ (UPF0313 family)
MNILFLTSAAPKVSPFYTGEKRPPLGVGLLMSVMKNRRHQVYFSDEYLQPSDILDTDFVEKNKIDFVAVYTNTVCYTSTLEMFSKLQAKREKKVWSGKIIVGGPHASIAPESIPEYVDHIAIGEGEDAIDRIVNGNCKERILQGKKIKDLDTLPRPAWEEFVYQPYDWSHELLDAYPVYTMNTSRGCPYNCIFCSVKAIWERTYRYQSPERIVDDIEFMVKHYGARGIYFREDHFLLNKKRITAFCELLLKKNIKIEWACETRADLLGDLEYQKLVKAAGCRAYYIGVESGSPRMLEIMQKGVTREQLIKAFEIAHKLGIKTYASMLVGIPGETENDLKQTDEMLEIIKPDKVGFNVYTGIPGSKLYDYVLKEGLYEYRDPVGILYLKGHNERIKKYCSDNNALKIPGSLSEVPEVTITYDKNELSKDENFDIQLFEKREKISPSAALLEEYMEKLLLSLNDEERQNFALYGAGEHTLWTLDIMRRISILPRVIIDDQQMEETIQGIPVETLDNVLSQGVETIIISSDCWHFQIGQKLREAISNNNKKNIRIIDPYLYLPKAPYNKE